jgi:NhaC family Na+:H+ antiporter
MLGFNVYVYGDEALSSNQFVLLLGAAVARLLVLTKSLLIE